MKKSKSARGAPITDLVILDEDEPWETLQAQILVKISDALNPTRIDYSDYLVNFTVPRHVTTPMPLNSSTKHKYLVENALKIKTAPGCKIVVEPKDVSLHSKYGLALTATSCR